MSKANVPHYFWSPGLIKHGGGHYTGVVKCRHCTMEAQRIRVEARAVVREIAEGRMMSVSIWQWRWRGGKWKGAWQLPPCLPKAKND